MAKGGRWRSVCLYAQSTSSYNNDDDNDDDSDSDDFAVDDNCNNFRWTGSVKSLTSIATMTTDIPWAEDHGGFNDYGDDDDEYDDGGDIMMMMTI